MRAIAGSPSVSARLQLLCLAGHAAATSSEEWEARVESAEAATQEAEAGMNDLLICLGQEERKVEALSEQLRARGVDVEALLEALPDQDTEDDLT